MQKKKKGKTYLQMMRIMEVKYLPKQQKCHDLFLHFIFSRFKAEPNKYIYQMNQRKIMNNTIRIKKKKITK